MMLYDFQLRFYWSLFLSVNQQYSIIGPDNGLVPSMRQATVWTSDG